MYKAVKKDEIPPDWRVSKSTISKWAKELLIEFWNSGDEAWQIMEDKDGNAITNENLYNVASNIRCVSYKLNEELQGKIKVSIRNGKLYIYAEEN